MGRGLGELQQRIMTIVERERVRGHGTALADPQQWLSSHTIAAELFGEHADDTDRRNVARALVALERRGLVSSVLPPARRIYF